MDVFEYQFNDLTINDQILIIMANNLFLTVPAETIWLLCPRINWLKKSNNHFIWLIKIFSIK